MSAETLPMKPRSAWWSASWVPTSAAVGLVLLSAFLFVPGRVVAG